MYTDDYQAYEAYDRCNVPPAPPVALYRVSEGKGARDQYGLNVGQKMEIGNALADAAHKFERHEIIRATIELDDQRRMVVSSVGQAMNLCEYLTGCDIYSVMAGKPKKLASRSKIGKRWNVSH